MRLMICLFCLLLSAFCFCEGQTTHNIDIIWQKASPDPGGWASYWGFHMAGGDLNGDGYSDFVSSTCSLVQSTPQRVRCKIYIFNGGPTLSTIPSQIITYDSLYSTPSLCIADFNGDGTNDLVVGDRGGIGIYHAKGQVNIHYGIGGLLNNTPDLVIGGSADYSNFGSSLSSGDINGDGIADLIVGAPDYGDMNARGRVYVYYGDTLGLHTWPDIILNGHTEAGYYENFGNTIDGKVDYNNDGFNDLLIGAYLNAKNGNSAGKIYYYIGDNAPIDTIADGWFYGEASFQMLGLYNVSSVMTDSPSINPMGWFGTPDWPTATGSFGEGKCYLVPGDTTGEITPEWTVTGEDTALGFWSSSAGYADGDRLGDMLAGASPAYNEYGRAYLWLRRPNMLSQYDAYIQGRHDGSSGIGDVLGARVAFAGDVDGDGKDEFMVSNYYADDNNMIWLCKYTGPNAGVAGPSTPLGDRPTVRLFPNVPNPFKQSTKITYQIAKPGRVSLRIYNIQGQLVRTLEDGHRTAGAHQVSWNGRDDCGNGVSNGVYIYQLRTGGEDMAKKMMLLRQ